MKKVQQGLGAWLSLCTHEDPCLNSWYPHENKNQNRTKQKQARLHKSQCCVRCRQEDSWGVLAVSLDQNLCLREIRQRVTELGHPTSSCGLFVCLRACTHTCTHTGFLLLVKNLLVVCGFVRKHEEVRNT